MIERAALLRALDNHIRRVERGIEGLEQRHRRYSWYRLSVFLAALGASFLVGFTQNGARGLAVLGVGLACFGVLAFLHNRLERVLERHRYWRDIKKAHRARALLDWAAIPKGEPAAVAPGHPFAADLDIVGPQSLHQLVDVSVSLEGSDRLRAWLTAESPDWEKSQSRQRLVRELASLTRFRDKLLLSLGLGASGRRDGGKLAGWITAAPAPALGITVVQAFLLVLANYVLVAGSLVGWLGRPYWEVSLAAYLFFQLKSGQSSRQILQAVALLEDQLESLARVLRFLEKYPCGSSRALADLCGLFRDRETRPSTQVRRIRILSALAGLRMNPIVGLILNLLLPWDLLVAWLVNRQRRRLVELVPAWLDRCAEIEALMSLACFGYLNPGYCIPELVSGSADGGFFDAGGLGHPLIPHAGRINNDFSVRESQIVVLTGSNMSGKSTFIKTLGINLALAMAGGPCAARRVTITPFRIFSCIKVSDSVQDHVSTFYAEVRRLKSLLGALEQTAGPPLFYVIDEIFRGTNNRERLIGARSYLRALIGKRGAGVITTHDLELAWLAEALAGVSNFHFREDIEGDQMVFDYRLRPGVCPTTNALKIMKMEGLPVTLPEGDAGQRIDTEPRAERRDSGDAK